MTHCPVYRLDRPAEHRTWLYITNMNSMRLARLALAIPAGWMLSLAVLAIL